MNSYKVIYEGWHRHLEAYVPSTTLPTFKQHKGSTSNVPEPEEEEEVAVSPPSEPESEPEQPDDQDKTIAGINGEEYPDSLRNMLEPLKSFLSKDERGRLQLLMLKAAEEDDIVLEAIGGPDREPRTFSPNTTRDLNDLIASFNLDSEDQQKLEKTIKMWAKLNTVKFSAPPRDPDTDIELPPKASAPVDGDPEPEDEENSVLDKAMGTVKQKAQDLGVEIPDVEQVKAALDAISLVGLTGAGEIVATPATIASLALNIATKDWDDALIDVVSLLPVAGKAFKASAKGAKLTAKGAKAAKVVKAIDQAAVIADVVKKGKAAGNVAKNLGTVFGSRLDKKDLQAIFKIKDFITKLEEAGIFGDAPSELLAVFADMRMAANTAQNKKAPPQPGEFRSLYQDDDDLTESLKRLQTLSGINKRIL